MKKLATLDDLLVHELRDLYDAEQQILKALPDLIEAASASELRTALESHLRQTENQVERLRQAFSLLDTPARGTRCDGMAGLIAEGEKLLKERADPDVRDAAIISVAQKIEHYEIAGYGCVATYAQMLGRTEIRDLLSKTLDEEETADERLSELAESIINVRAGGSNNGGKAIL